MASITLYDLPLVNFEGKCWSPNTSKARVSLNIKGIPFETVWVPFADIATVIPKLTKTAERPTVPIIVDASKDIVVQDSWKIAQYLEATYPDTPSLFHGDEDFHKAAEGSFGQCFISMFRLVVLTIANNAGNEEEKIEFRKNREAKFGTTIENFAGNPEDNIKIINEELKDTRSTLAKSPYLSGPKVGWKDAVLYSYLKFVDILRHDIFEPRILNAVEGDNSLKEWYQRMSKYA
ncbi:hypothetical protein CLU79DRAFT_781788 [Phycomyces nitens]|nr:hypothetical protein CLU79DRAFT_781788 [Phycomyces nitens]